MKRMLSIILCSLIFCSYFILEFNINFSKAFSDDYIKNISYNTNIVNKENVTKEELYWNTKLNTIYNNALKYNLSKEEINKILDSDEMKEFIFNYFNGFKNSVLYENSNPFNKNQLNIYLVDSINKYLNNNNINNVTKNNINNFIVDNSSEIINEITPENINYESNDILNSIKSFFSNKTKLILSLILILSSSIVFILNLKNKKWMLYIGITMLVSSIIMLLFTTIINPVMTIVLNADLSIIISFINNLSNVIIKSYYITNIPLLLVSIIILVSYLIIKEKNMKSK